MVLESTLHNSTSLSRLTAHHLISLKNAVFLPVPESTIPRQTQSSSQHPPVPPAPPYQRGNSVSASATEKALGNH